MNELFSQQLPSRVITKRTTRHRKWNTKLPRKIFATRLAGQEGRTIPRVFAINSDAVFNQKVYLTDSHILHNRINRIIARDVCHEQEKEREREGECSTFDDVN